MPMAAMFCCSMADGVVGHGEVAGAVVSMVVAVTSSSEPSEHMLQVLAHRSFIFGSNAWLHIVLPSNAQASSRSRQLVTFLVVVVANVVSPLLKLVAIVIAVVGSSEVVV